MATATVSACRRIHYQLRTTQEFPIKTLTLSPLVAFNFNVQQHPCCDTYSSSSKGRICRFPVKSTYSRYSSLRNSREPSGGTVPVQTKRVDHVGSLRRASHTLQHLALRAAPSGSGYACAHLAGGLPAQRRREDSLRSCGYSCGSDPLALSGILRVDPILVCYSISIFVHRQGL